MSKLRKEDPIDYPVMTLEGLWWVEDGQFDINIKEDWFYTLVIMQPDHITPAIFGCASIEASSTSRISRSVKVWARMLSIASDGSTPHLRTGVITDTRGLQ